MYTTASSGSNTFIRSRNSAYLREKRVLRVPRNVNGVHRVPPGCSTVAVRKPRSTHRCCGLGNHPGNSANTESRALSRETPAPLADGVRGNSRTMSPPAPTQVPASGTALSRASLTLTVGLMTISGLCSWATIHCREREAPYRRQRWQLKEDMLYADHPLGQYPRKHDPMIDRVPAWGMHGSSVPSGAHRGGRPCPL